MNRRKFLLLTSAAGGVAAVGGIAFVLSDHYRGWIRRILHRDLPGYNLEAKGLTQYMDEYFAKQGGASQLRLFAAAEGVVDVEPLLPTGKARLLREEERRILTNFLLGSDFFANYPNGPKEIIYSGAPKACRSPFAKF